MCVGFGVGVRLCVPDRWVWWKAELGQNAFVCHSAPLPQPTTHEQVKLAEDRADGLSLELQYAQVRQGGQGIGGWLAGWLVGVLDSPVTADALMTAGLHEFPASTASATVWFHLQLHLCHCAQGEAARLAAELELAREVAELRSRWVGG